MRFPYTWREKKRIKCEFSNLPHVGEQSADYLRISFLWQWHTRENPSRTENSDLFFLLLSNVGIRRSRLNRFSFFSLLPFENAKMQMAPLSVFVWLRRKKVPAFVPQKKRNACCSRILFFFGGYDYVSKYALFEPTQKQTIIISPHLEGKLGALHAPLLYELCRSSNTCIFLGMYL